MKITFLGTAAAEGYPDPFCRCDNCEGARRIGGKALRKRASALIDDVFLIDFGPDLLPASQIHNVPLTGVEYAAQTHPHDDHFFFGNFIHRTDRCLVNDAPRLQYAVSPWVARQFKVEGAGYFRDEDDLGSKHFPSLKVDLVVQDAWETVTLGPYSILAIPAEHAPGRQARILAIRKGDGPAFLYGTDTAPMPDGVWERVAKEGWSFDLVIMDHTHGTEKNSSVHHSSESMLLEVERMKQAGAATGSTRIIAHHFAHHSNPLPDEFDTFAGERGYEVAWDGLVVNV